MDSVADRSADRLSRRDVLQLGGAAVLAGTGMVVFSSREAFAAEPATVTVNAATNRGTYNNLADYFSMWMRGGPAIVLGVDDMQQLHSVQGKIGRTFLFANSMSSFYDFDNDTFQFGIYYDELDNLTSAVERVSLAIAAGGLDLFESLAEYKSVWKQGLAHYKDRYPTIEWIEAINEPNVHMLVDEYYDYYQIWYEIVNEVNAELNPSIPIKVGGPAVATFQAEVWRDYVEDFLTEYADDPNPAKKLDFVSYHQYGPLGIDAVLNHVTWIRGWLSARSLPVDIPILYSEFGAYGGPNGPSYESDVLTDAAGKASYAWHAIEASVGDPTGIIQMHWVARHRTNTRKNWFVDANGGLNEGASGQPLDGVPTPTFNMIKMLRMLNETLLASSSDTPGGGGRGVRAIATKDGAGVAVLVFNYQGNGTFNAPQYDTTLNVNNLPSIFNGKNIHVETWLVDQDHSNYWTNENVVDTRLAKTNNQILSGGSSFSGTGLLKGNAVSLIKLTPTTASTGPGPNMETVADAYVQRGEPTTNFGTKPVLLVKNASDESGLDRWAYLKFDLTGLTENDVTDARLRLFARVAELPDPITTRVHAVAGTGWNEDGITWNTKPALGAVLDTITITGNNATWYELDVTSHIHQELAANRTSISLAMRNNTQTPNVIHITSRETAAPPHLNITE